METSFMTLFALILILIEMIDEKQRSNAANRLRSFPEESPIFFAEIGDDIAKDFFEGHSNSYKHHDRKEDDSEDTGSALQFRHEFEGKSEETSDDADDEHSQNDQQVPTEEDEYHQHSEQKEEDKLKRRFEDAGQSISACFLTARTVATRILMIFCSSCSAWLCDHRNQLTILIVFSVVSWVPISPTDIAKLILASASHMVASLILLDNKLALNALSIVQIALKEFHLVLVAVSFMLFQQTFPAELRLAFIANHHILDCGSNESLTIFFGTQLNVGIVCSDVKLMQLPVTLLNVRWKLFEEIRGNVDECVAIFPRASHLFKGLDLVDNVVVEAGLTEIEAVFTVAHVRLLITLFHLGFANLTGTYLAHFLQLAAEHASQLRFLHVHFATVLHAALGDAGSKGLLHELRHTHPAGHGHLVF